MAKLFASTSRNRIFIFRMAWNLLSEPFLFDAGEPQRHSPIESAQPIFDPEINDPRKFTLVIGDHGVTQC
jgi:hypothetical protein